MKTVGQFGTMHVAGDMLYLESSAPWANNTGAFSLHKSEIKAYVEALMGAESEMGKLILTPIIKPYNEGRREKR